MGSTTPPAASSPPSTQSLDDQRRRFSAQHQTPEVNRSGGGGGGNELSYRELRQLLEQKELEIRFLKLEIERYKLALKNQASNNEAERLACARKVVDDTIESLLSPATEKDSNSNETIDSVARIEANLSKDTSSQIRISSKLDDTNTGYRVSKDDRDDDEDDVGDGDDNDVDDNGSEHETVTGELMMVSISDHISEQAKKQQDIVTAELQEIAQDVDEIDLNLEMNKNNQKRRKQRKNIDDHLGEIVCDINEGKKQCTDNDAKDEEEDVGKEEDDDNGDDEDDIITEGLLTSLTDAAISNLSQLAALQERCESQQHSQQESLPHEEFQQTITPTVKSSQSLKESSANLSRQSTSANILSSTPVAATSTPVGTSSSSSRTSRNLLSQSHHTIQPDNRRASYDIQDPFSDSNLANQAALALSAIGSHSSLMAQPISSSPPEHMISPNSTASSIQASQDLNSNQSLASVVVAAAAAAAEAAAADDEQSPPSRQQHTTKQHHLPPNQQQQQQQQQQHLHLQQSRLISSAAASSDYYHNLHHQQAAGSVVHQISSPISSLHFSPSITSPSPSSSLIGGPSHHTRRSASNASSSLLSPIASPNYLRRQFIPERGIPLMSPSPTTSLATVGSSSGIGSAAGSAHMLQLAHHHHPSAQQQRSASAMAGHITAQPSSSMAPLSSGAASTTAVSPLMSSKNSSQARLNNMQIRHKFGYLGSGRGQFNSPHGFCLGLNQEIVVADTNNHRVCIFDKDGTYITQFGSPGKEEGQLWNPRKVAILHRPINGTGGSSGSAGSSAGLTSGSSSLHQRNESSSVTTFSSNFTSGGGIQSTGSSGTKGNHFASEPLYVVCDRGAERSRMQLFTKDGSFIKKIGIHYIDIVAGLAITQNGLIIVVDSVSPTVYIINAETGTLNGWFDCSGHMKEPSDIAVKSDIPGVEYFICDFKGHCVVVFSEQGDFLRKIGHDGLTSYPNGIDISDDGDILVGDSHGNRFHVVVFDRHGNFVSQFECPHVKVSRCCGLKITREGYIVTLAKNNHHVLVLDTIHI